MRARILVVLAVTAASALAYAQGNSHFNPVIDLLAAKKPVFGLYPPPAGGRGGRGGRGNANADSASAVPAPPPKTQTQIGQEAVAHASVDYIFDGSMEGGARFDDALGRFSDMTKAMFESSALQRTPVVRMSHPLFVKTPRIATDPNVARERIAKQLNAGVSGVVFVGVESADEVKQGLAMMRFKSKGGTRPDDVGNAPALWGMTEKQYREKADLWPLNPKGELVNFTIVESKEGLAHVREIAAVKGIGVLLPGAGTLGGVFTTTDSTGRRMRDSVAWEGAIQQVLAACKEFKVPCGYPANNLEQMESRMKQGFSVFISNWGEAAFQAIDASKKASGR